MCSKFVCKLHRCNEIVLVFENIFILWLRLSIACKVVAHWNNQRFNHISYHTVIIIGESHPQSAGGRPGR
jgi:hypothetical protein